MEENLRCSHIYYGPKEHIDTMTRQPSSMESFGVCIISLILLLMLTKNLSSNALGDSIKDEEGLKEDQNEMENSLSNNEYVFEIPFISSCNVLLSSFGTYICVMFLVK